jgi:hypothetical protein
MLVHKELVKSRRDVENTLEFFSLNHKIRK